MEANTDESGDGNGVSLVHQAARAVSTREDFGSLEMHTSGELATVALMAQAKAAIESRYKMALARPRNEADVRQRILAECRRPKFADEAIYAVQRGKVKDPRTGEWVDNIVEGPSIRFVEMALRCMGNTYTKVLITHEDDRKLIVNVSVTDLESNTTYDGDVTIAKTMERSKLREGQNAIGIRTNASGKRVFIVEAPEGELLNKQNALASKTLRTQGLRLIPGDIVAEAVDLCNAILANKDAQDPDGERKKIADAFATMRIMPSDLEGFLGNALDRATPAQIGSLRKLYTALRDGIVTWQDIETGKVKADPVKDAKEASAQAPANPPSAPSSSAAAAPQQAPAGPSKPTPAPEKPTPAPQPPTATANPTTSPAAEAAPSKLSAVDQAGKDGTWTPPPPPETTTSSATETAAPTPSSGTSPGSTSGGSFDKAVEDARAKDAERAPPKKGMGAAKDAVKKATGKAKADKPAPSAQPDMFAGGEGVPPPTDDDLPAWAGGGKKADDPPAEGKRKDGQPF